MNDELKDALREYTQATEEVNKEVNRLCCFELKKPQAYFNQEQLSTLEKALEKERAAKRKYYTLFFQRIGRSQDWINEWLKKERLSEE